MKKRFVVIAVAIVALVFAGIAVAGKPSWQKDQEAMSNTIAEAFVGRTPYPTSVLNGVSAERQNLTERLVRFSTPGKIGYVYIITALGKPLGYYTISGKVSSTQSQLTTPTQSFDCGDNCESTVESIGDDGSFGQEEPGVFFFTTGGVMIETDQSYIYSDAPLPLTGVPSLNPKGKPSSTSKHWKETHKG